MPRGTLTRVTRPLLRKAAPNWPTAHADLKFPKLRELGRLSAPLVAKSAALLSEVVIKMSTGDAQKMAMTSMTAVPARARRRLRACERAREVTGAEVAVSVVIGDPSPASVRRECLRGWK